jgi:hypothetical protein
MGAPGWITLAIVFPGKFKDKNMPYCVSVFHVLYSCICPVADPCLPAYCSSNPVKENINDSTNT